MFKQMRLNLKFLTTIFSLTLLVSGFFVFNRVEAGEVGVEDTVAPTLNPASYVEATKTITYTFSEPMQLVAQADAPAERVVTPFNPSLIGIYEVVGGNYYGLDTKADVNIASASLVGNVLTVTYSGNLEKKANATYTLDTWGYDITDLAGNKISKEELSKALFTINAVSPTINETGFTASGKDMPVDSINGYTLTTKNDNKEYLIQFKNGTAASEILESGYFGLFLKNSSEIGPALKTYYAAKESEPYLTYLNNAADGKDAFAFINGNTVKLVDGARHHFGAPDSDMAIPGDAPAGKYILEGKIKDIAGNETIVTYTLTITKDTEAPTAQASYDNSTKVITYTFNEPVQITNNDDTDITDDIKSKLAIYKIDASGDYDLDTKMPNQITEAIINGDLLTIKYDGSLIEKGPTTYVVDAWGYKIADMVGNKMLPALNQIFTVAGDSVYPTATVTEENDSTGGTITYTFSEPVKLVRQADGKDTTFDQSLIKIYQINIANGDYGPETSGMAVTTANLSNKTLTATYSGSLEKNKDVYYLIDAWGYNITDLVGNKIQKSLTLGDQIFEVKAVRPTAGDLIMTTKLHPEGIKISGPNNNGEYILPDLQMDGADVFDSLTVVVSDTNLNTGNVPVYIDGNLVSNGYMHYDGSIWNYEGQTSRPVFDNGPHTLAATFKDLAGNETPLVAKFTTDNISPDLLSVSFTSNNGEVSTGQDFTKDQIITTEIGRIVISMSATLKETATLVSGDKGIIKITGPLMGSPENITAPYGTFTINGANVTITPNEGNAVLAHVGTFTFSVEPGTIQDEAGNKNEKVEFMLSVDADHTAPKLTLKGNSNITIKYKDSYIDQGATFTDLVDATRTIPGDTVVNTDIIGTYTIKYNATDIAGNKSNEVIRTVIVEDTIKPIISDHENITAEATSTAGAVITYTNPIATDNYDTSVSVTCLPASGTTFALGTTIVNCTAMDSSRNSATPKSFSVTVQDTTAPVITLLGNTPITTYRGSLYTDAGATVTDNYDNKIEITSEGEVNTSVVGTYTITYNATDSSKNSAEPVIRTINVVRTPSSGGSKASPAQNIEGCKPGELFNTSTGKSCTLKAIPANPNNQNNQGEVLGAEKFNFTSLLKMGSQGNEVIELQKLLNTLGYDCGMADGHFGPKTKAAVIKFQIANGLIGDGVVGALTRAALNK